MAQDKDTARPAAPARKTALGQPAPLPLAERRRLSLPARAPATQPQIFSDFAMI